MGDSTRFWQARSLRDLRDARRRRILSAVLLAAFVPSYLFSWALTGAAFHGATMSQSALGVAAEERAWDFSRAFLTVPVGLLVASVYLGARGRVGPWRSIWWVYIAVLLLLFVLVSEAQLFPFWS